MKSSSVSKGGVMINPIRKKIKIHAERMGLVDIANKVDELVKEHNKVLDLLQAKEEASKGECSKCGCEYPIHKGDCPELYPPEHEEEWERDFRDKVDDGEIYGRDMGEIDFQLRDYIRDNFISKKKIKRVLKECKKITGHRLEYLEGNQDVIFSITESLGLGD